MGFSGEKSRPITEKEEKVESSPPCIGDFKGAATVEKQEQGMES